MRTRGKDGAKSAAFSGSDLNAKKQRFDPDWVDIEPFPVNKNGEVCISCFDDEVRYSVLGFSVAKRVVVLRHEKSHTIKAFYFNVEDGNTATLQMLDWSPLNFDLTVPVTIEHRQDIFDGKIFWGVFFVSAHTFKAVYAIGNFYNTDGSFDSHVFSEVKDSRFDKLTIPCEL